MTTGSNKNLVSLVDTKCSLCDWAFDPEDEGICGVIGTFITANFCGECLNGVLDMADQLRIPDEFIDEDD